MLQILMKYKLMEAEDCLRTILGPSCMLPWDHCCRSRQRVAWLLGLFRLLGKAVDGCHKSSSIFRAHLAMEAEKRPLFWFGVNSGLYFIPSQLTSFGRWLDHVAYLYNLRDPYEVIHSVFSVPAFTVIEVLE